METLETSCVCRLCGKQSGILINIFDVNENHIKKINAVLPIMVHEMDLLPKHMCHRCSYKLEEFHKFFVDCLNTDKNLKSQLSWMRKADAEEKIGIPMVHIKNIKIKVEPSNYHIYEIEPVTKGMDYLDSTNSMTFPMKSIRTDSIHKNITYGTDKERIKNYKRILRCTSNETNTKDSAQSAKKNLFAQSTTSDYRSNTISKEADSRKHVTMQRTNENSCLNIQSENLFSNSNSRTSDDNQKRINEERRIERRSIDRLARNLRPRNIQNKNLINGVVRDLRPRKKAESSRDTKLDNIVTPLSATLKIGSTSNDSDVKLKSSEIKSTLDTVATNTIVSNLRNIETRSHTIDTRPNVSSRTKSSSNVEIKSANSCKTDVNSRHIGTQKIIKIKSRSTETEKIVSAKTESNSIPLIKIEKPDNTEERFLRPRLKVIDYLDSTRKPSSFMTNRKRKSRTSKKLPTDTSIETLIKKEIPDPDNPPFDVSRNIMKLRNTCGRSIDDNPMNSRTHEQGEIHTRTKGRTDTLPNNIVLKIKTEPDTVQSEDKFKSIIGSKSSSKISKNCLKNENRSPCSSPKHLRSQDVRLRNGKVKNVNDTKKAARKIRRNLNHVNIRNHDDLKKLPFLVKSSSVSRKIYSLCKALDNMKLYCEECNVTFASKELFKLHSCYNS